MATAEKRVMSDQTEADQFADDFREGEAMARDWIAGKGALPDLMSIVKDMPRDLAGLEAGFLSTVDAAARGRQGAAGAPDPAKAQMALAPQPTPEPPPAPTISLDEMLRRRRERERATKLEFYGQRNAAAWGDMASMGRRGWGD
jgi:hypothetical protein